MNSQVHEQPSPPPTSSVLGRLVEAGTPVGQAFETLLFYAASRKATDVFCVATREGHTLLMRSEGTLYRLGDVSRAWGEHFIGHVKVLAQLRIVEHRHPQDGRLLLMDSDTPIDMRVSTLPTFFGEELAIRILDRRFKLVDLDKLGMLADQHKRVEELIHERSGLVLVTGRTGSGKTTTLYAILNELNDGTHKINTLEDPVECYLPGVHQTQINPRLGQDFADLLPALLRHAPDVIMVGEIRDVETAKIALQAAAAGHAVFATLHASSAARGIHSMLQLNVNPHVFAGALRGVISQDLLRKVCEYCAQPGDMGDFAEFIKTEELTPWLPAGFAARPRRRSACPRCENLGYRGQIGIFELLRCTAPIRELIRQQASPETIEAKAVDEGLVPLRVGAQLAVVKGLTTIEEAMPIVNDVPVRLPPWDASEVPRPLGTHS